MRRRSVLVFVAGAAALWGAWAVAADGVAAVPARARAVQAVGSWGRAIEVPGLGALNQGGDAIVKEVSCASAGNCAAGGSYRDGRRHYQGFVAVERNSVWGRAIEVPGLGALNKGGNAEVVSVSCASAGNCAAGGDYRASPGHHQGFVVSEQNGQWGRAIEVPGLGALNKGGNAGVDEVSCGSAGGCSAGGFYRDRSGFRQAFVVSEQNGRWRTAIEVPGTAALNAGHQAEAFSVSCAPAGGCAAGGFYTDKSRNAQGFVAVQHDGRWGRAIEVPGLGALNAGGGSEDIGGAQVLAVSCASAGNCAAGGSYSDSSANVQGFVVIEKNGVWGRASKIAGLAALNDSGDAYVGSMSCPSAGNCIAAGDYDYAYDWGFVAVEKNGVWGRAINVPGLGAVATGRYADASSVSCALAGNCAITGGYEDMTKGGSLDQGYVVSEANGRWARAIEMPGKGGLNKGGEAEVVSVSCGSAGNCAAGGYYADARGHSQGFVVDEKTR